MTTARFGVIQAADAEASLSYVALGWADVSASTLDIRMYPVDPDGSPFESATSLDIPGTDLGTERSRPRY
jgi:hypothetical protein